MSIHKLTAGSGYDYLTRQVAAQDVTEKGHTGLASYYAAKGEAPGQWVGSGMAGVDGLSAGDVVTAEQMQALFGSGHHPLAQQRRDRLQGPDLTDRDYQAVTRLGVPYKVYARDVSTFRLEVAQRIAELNISRGADGSAAREGAVSVEDRARLRTEVAVDFFRREHGRDPADAREIAATIAKHSRPRTTAVAGYDLTFSPVKSVSVLWAIADPATAARIERAHQAAVQDALAFLEEHALYTRVGTNGVRQVNVQGLVATAFTHRDSRAGDPDLHTHVAVANKVQTIDPGGAGRWLSIDGRVLFKANVAASELIAGALTPANVVLALMAYLAVKYAASLLAAAAWWLAALVLVVGVPYLILFRALRNGSADDRQVVRRSQRPALMASAAGAVTFALVVLYLAGAPRPLVWLILAMICGLVAMGLTTMVWKASMHMAVAAGVIAVLAIEVPGAGIAAALLLPVLGWARWRDGRHSVMQLAGGAVIGATVAGVVYGFLR